MWIGGVLAALLVADLALAGILYESAREAPQAMRREAVRLKSQEKLYRADVTRGQKIRDSLAEARNESDNFYESTFPDAATGYSVVEADLDSIAAKSGLADESVKFKQKDLKDHGVTEITISETVEGDYPSILHFIDGIERSKKFYLLRDLSLNSASTTAGSGGIRLTLELQTYFRT